MDDNQPMPEFVYADLCHFDNNERSTTYWETSTTMPKTLTVEPPANHPEKPWGDYSNCVETYDVLPAMDIFQIDIQNYWPSHPYYEKCTFLGANSNNCYVVFFRDESIEISVPENQFRDEGYTLSIFLKGVISPGRKEMKNRK